MSVTQVVGSIGVALLLFAFFMNSTRRWESDSRVYHAFNAAGAAISGYASYLIGYAPFVVLEATWCGVAIVALARARR